MWSEFESFLKIKLTGVVNRLDVGIESNKLKIILRFFTEMGEY